MLEQKVQRAPIYDPQAVQPMRDELVAVGFEELRTAEDVERVMGETRGTLLVVINSVCGCAAGSARPGVALALQHTVIPDRLATVFAGMEHEAVARVRELHPGYPPSSPSMVLFQDGKLAAMVERRMIEGRNPQQLAAELAELFTRHCSRPGPSIPASDFARLEFAKICGSAIPRV
ncbi:MAG: BrxA/BrxB family bacilliredoxin [Candidatus Methylomirabilales bacterium]